MRFPSTPALYRLHRLPVVIFSGILLAWGTVAVVASEAEAQARVFEKDFLDVVELAPFEVVDQQLVVSVYARSRKDRKYAVGFAEEVLEFTYESLGTSAGYGLVIVGEKREPHPLFVFYRFLEMAREGRLNPGLEGAADALAARIQEWKDKVQMDKQDAGGEDGIELEFETLIPAIPLPLEGIASKLYQIAWVEDFDESRIESRLSTLTPEELASDELSAYDWVFFLPHRGAFSEVLNEVIEIYMQQKRVNFFTAAAIRAAVFTFKPLIKGAFERIRKGMLYLALLRARTDFGESDVNALVERFIEALTFDGRQRGQSKRDYVVAELTDQLKENAWFAANPFVAPEPLESYDLAAYRHLAGDYAKRRKPSHRLTLKNDSLYWQYLKQEPVPFHPAGNRLLVHAQGAMTLRFEVDARGAVTGVWERWPDRRNWLKRK